MVKLLLQHVFVNCLAHHTPFATVLSKSSGVSNLSSIDPTGNARVATSASDVHSRLNGSFATISIEGRSLIFPSTPSRGRILNADERGRR